MFNVSQNCSWEIFANEYSIINVKSKIKPSNKIDLEHILEETKLVAKIQYETATNIIRQLNFRLVKHVQKKTLCLSWFSDLHSHLEREGSIEVETFSFALKEVTTRKWDNHKTKARKFQTELTIHM